MRSLLFLPILLITATAAATAQTATVDPRALEACQIESSNFVDIRSCLPDAHVAVKALDAFSTIYPSEAQQIRERCLELNDQVAGAMTCTVQAVKSAVELAALLPEGSALNDAVFEGARDPDHLVKLEAVIDEARALFPEKRMWGGGIYRQYR